MLKSGGDPPDWSKFEGLRLLFPSGISVKVDGQWSKYKTIINNRGSPLSTATTPIQAVKEKFRQEAGPIIGQRVSDVENMVLQSWNNFDIERLWKLLRF